MQITPDQGIPFPEGEDFGNGALQLQYLAETVDSRLFAQETELLSVLYPAAKIVSNTAGVSLAANNTQKVVWDRLIYNKGFSVSTTIQLRENGTYMMGAYLDLQALGGAITANSVRSMTLSVALPQFPDPIAGLTVQSATNSIVEPGTGDSFLTTQLIFDYEAVQGQLATPPSVTWIHTNAAAVMSVQANSMMWIVKLSDLES